MRKWRRQIRAALVMGLTWAAGWWFVGMGIEWIHDVWPNPLGRFVDIWPAALALPAFFSGLAFAVLLGIAARNRKFADLSLRLFAAVGAAAGALVSFAPVFLAITGLADIKAPYTAWGITGPLIVPCGLLGAVSATVSLLLARRAEGRAWLAGEPEVAELGPPRDAALESRPTRAKSRVGRHHAP